MKQTTPAFICIYGQSGIGKTTDMGFAFPKGVFVASEGATKSIVSTCGYKPREVTAETIDDVTAIVDRMISGEIEGKELVVDDFSYIIENSVMDLSKQFTGWDIFSQLKNRIFEFRRKARSSGITTALNCWLKSPKTLDDGTIIRGCPKLPSDYGEAIPAMCDLVLRGDVYRKHKPHPYAYYCDSNAHWVGKDRDNGTPSPAPMNLGEILRMNGYEIPRITDWQEEKVAELSERIDAEGRQVAQNAYKKFCEKIPPQLAYWTVRDALDRSTLRSAKKNRWENISF